MMSVDYFKMLRVLSEEDFISLQLIDLSEVNENKQTLLHEAISSRKSLVAMSLIENGIDLNLSDKMGKTSLHYAVIYKNIMIVKEILEKGGNPNIGDVYGNCPIWTAGLNAKGDYVIVELLLKKGANPNIKNKSGKSVFDFAIQSRNINLWMACGGGKDEWKEI